MHRYPYLGFGLGLRPKHYDAVLESRPNVDWFEIVSEDYLIPGGRHLKYLYEIRERFPIVMHGVSLSIGSSDPIDEEYLKQLKHLAQQINPAWISDHLCWTGVGGINTHDLLPLPYTEEALSHVVERIIKVQEFLNKQILLENVSSYVSYQSSELTEWEFLTEVTKRADCLLLLDVNNIYVSAFNHGFDADKYLQGIPVERVCQFHLAGHSNYGSHIIDTHDNTIIDPVWELYKKAVIRFPKVSTLIERDDNIPEFPELVAELDLARKIVDQVSAVSKSS